MTSTSPSDRSAAPAAPGTPAAPAGPGGPVGSSGPARPASSAGDDGHAERAGAHDLSCEGEEPLEVLVAWGPPGRFDMSGFGSYREALAARGAATASRDGAPGTGDAARIRG